MGGGWGFEWAGTGAGAGTAGSPAAGREGGEDQRAGSQSTIWVDGSLPCSSRLPCSRPLISRPHYAARQARDINLDIKRVVAYRHWCNKLWNAIKFAMMNLPEGFVPPTEAELEAARPTYPLPSKWILSRLNGAVAGVIKVCAGREMASTLPPLLGVRCEGSSAGSE